ncbi:MAG: hypothetical protein WCD35_13120 [Mycobacteriales bacterium]
MQVLAVGLVVLSTLFLYWVHIDKLVARKVRIASTAAWALVTFLGLAVPHGTTVGLLGIGVLGPILLSWRFDVVDDRSWREEQGLPPLLPHRLGGVVPGDVTRYRRRLWSDDASRGHLVESTLSLTRVPGFKWAAEAS